MQINQTFLEEFAARWTAVATEAKAHLINQTFLEEFAARRDVGLEVYRVFIYLNARLDFHNIIRVPQVEIAKALGMHKQSVHRAIKKLVELGILIPGPVASAWRLNPNAGWKGKVVHLQGAQRQHLEPVK